MSRLFERSILFSDGDSVQTDIVDLFNGPRNDIDDFDLDYTSLASFDQLIGRRWHQQIVISFASIVRPIN